MGRGFRSTFLKVCQKGSLTFLIPYLERALKFGDLTFAAFRGFRFEVGKGFIIEDEGIVVCSSLGLGTFITDVSIQAFLAFLVSLNFGSHDLFKEKGVNGVIHDSLRHELFGCVLKGGKGVICSGSEMRVIREVKGRKVVRNDSVNEV